jgi:hypothetical protein
VNDTAAGQEKIEIDEVTQNKFDTHTFQENSYESSVIDGTFAQTQQTEITSQSNIYEASQTTETQTTETTTLIFDTDDSGIDFSNMGENSLSNIDVIDLTTNSDAQNSDYEIKQLSLVDVLELTDSNNNLTILGDNADRVELLNSDGNNWSKSGDLVQENGHTFDVYANSGDASVELKIEVNIVDNIV